MINIELNKEKQYLQIVYEKLLQTEKELTDILKTTRSEGLSTLKDMSGDVRLDFSNVSDNLDTFSVLEMKNREIDQMNIKMKTADLSLQKVKRLLETPYFGKINVDFLDEEPEEAFYIGINNFADKEGNNLVYDWRSPISELFYNNVIGSSFYMANRQRIDVAIKGRRQFIIEKNTLLNYFDTSIAIQDDVLLEALEQDSTKQMKDITSTIQQEQNRIIRDMKNSNILVNGVAGSGKTSTIMQRIAYLLYSLRQEITSDNILILSPNNKFIDYLSKVLPSLGERNPLNMTLLQLVEHYLSLPLENEESYFSRISQEAVNSQTNVLRSLNFIEHLKKADRLLLSVTSFFKDITHNNKVIISKEKIIEIYQSTPDHASMLHKVQATKKQLSRYWEKRIRIQAKNRSTQNQILSLSEELQQKYFGELITDDSEESVFKYGKKLLTKKYHRVTKSIDSTTWIDTKVLFDLLYFDYQKESYIHSKEHLNLDEAIIWLTIQNTFIEKIEWPQMRFVLIDEVQDYTPAQVSLLSDLFAKSDFTMVGDENQAIFNSAITFQKINEIFETHQKQVQPYDLLNSYRSSGAITKLFSQLANSKQQMEISAVRPKGNDPQFFEMGNNQNSMNLFSLLLNQLKEERLTIITKTEMEAEMLRALLEDTPNIDVLPISLSKGLEFDNVLLYNVSDDHYSTERDQKILYTAISRGMKNLFITYECKLSRLLTI
ncbi:HelD family protein [Carnobacterium mobile]|uniref:HelD family protein n=1 Tax=Carnobacterium mobile TaxID=2750 RepID=UPI001867CDE9|nr:UvrD-helicase domain-containing protein [Carnobacterium mobile]